MLPLCCSIRAIRLIAPLAAAIVCCFFAGCGGPDAKVAGVVRLDGKPLTSGDVAFHPVSGGAVATGQIGPGGNYTLRTGDRAGVASGEYIATVVAVGAPPNDKDPPPVLTPEIYGRKDASPERKTVRPGSQVIDLDLKTPK